MRLIARGFANGATIFEDNHDIADVETDGLISDIAANHAEALKAHNLHMIEIEFPDEPNPLRRFFRFGTDPRKMVRPIELRIGGAK